MKALVFYAPGQLNLVELPIPHPRKGELLLKVVLAGICQTDVEIFAGRYQVKTPRIFGHEFVGEIVTNDNADIPIGKKVAVYPPIFCGECVQCRRGNQRHCLNFRCLGNTDDGGWAEYVIVNQAQIFDLDELLPEQAVWLEPLACVLTALSNHPPAFRETALVLGGGSMGMLFLQAILTTLGCHVALADPNPSRLALARKLGAALTIPIERNGFTPSLDAEFKNFVPIGFDLVVDTTGKPNVVEQAIKWAGPRSQIILFGVPNPATYCTLPLDQIFSREISLSGAVGNNLVSFKQGISLLSANHIQINDLVGRRIGLESVPGILRERSNPGPKGKIFIDPNIN